MEGKINFFYFLRDRITGGKKMATKKEAIVITPAICNVTSKLKEKGAGSFNCVQGYTVSTGSNFVHFVTARPDGVENNVAVGHMLGDIMSVSKNRELGHANDCAYYDSGFFIAQGGGNTTSTKIKRLDNSLNHVATYTYSAMKDSGKLTNITCIAHLSSKYFILGSGTKFAICFLDTNNNLLIEKSRFTITDTDLSMLKRDNCTRSGQGIYYSRGKLYKVYSYSSGTIIKKNDIAVFTLRGSSPLFSGATLDTIYSCDKTGKEFFEVESITSPDSGSTMYILANVIDSGESSDKDRIYSVSLS